MASLGTIGGSPQLTSVPANIVGASESFPTFDANGNLLGNLTSSQGQVPVPSLGLPTDLGTSLPLGGSAGNPAVAGAANATGISGGAIPPASTTGAVPAAPASSGNWFVRIVVVLLGFIFVAVGLSKFGAVQSATGAVKKIVT